MGSWCSDSFPFTLHHSQSQHKTPWGSGTWRTPRPMREQLPASLHPCLARLCQALAPIRRGNSTVKSVAMSHHSGSVWSMRTSSPSMSSAMATMCILISVPWGTAKAPLDCTMAGFSARQCTRISRPVMGVNHVFRPSTASSSSPRYCERRRTYPSHTAYRGRFRAASWRPLNPHPSMRMAVHLCDPLALAAASPA